MAATHKQTTCAQAMCQCGNISAYREECIQRRVHIEKGAYREWCIQRRVHTEENAYREECIKSA